MDKHNRGQLVARQNGDVVRPPLTIPAPVRARSAAEIAADEIDGKNNPPAPRDASEVVHIRLSHETYDAIATHAGRVGASVNAICHAILTRFAPKKPFA